MTNFMSYEHVIDIVTGLVPDRQDQDASLNVELCGRTILMFNNQILSRQKFGELGLDFMTYRRHKVRFVWTHNTTKPPCQGGSCDAS